jgi:hypothetical protein
MTHERAGDATGPARPDAPDGIVPRDLRFAIEDLPRYWHGGRRSVTIFFNNLSVFFPEGERFFIASVKAYAERAEALGMGAVVRAFCQQEGYHSREHVRYNEAVAAQGYPVPEMEGRVRRLLRGVRRRAPRRRQLAVTCALEHFTAIMAHLMLSDERLLHGAPPAMAALWRWHAVEENEHKAVAFDLFRAVGGRYAERVVVMVLATLIFWCKILEQQVRMMAADGILGSWREWAALWRFLFVEPGGLRPIFSHYIDYYRRDFHPWDLDNRGLLQAWQQGTAARGGAAG